MALGLSNEHNIGTNQAQIPNKPQTVLRLNSSMTTPPRQPFGGLIVFFHIHSMATAETSAPLEPLSSLASSPGADRFWASDCLCHDDAYPFTQEVSR